MRSEDDLRAAFAAKAGDAPRAEDVLRAVARAERAARPRGRRTWLRWLVPAVTVAAAAAVAVPLALSGSGSGSEKAGSASVASASAQTSAGGAGAQAPQARSQGAAAAVCRPDQVRAAITVHGNDATLTLTSGATACTVARVPVLMRPAPVAQQPGSAGSGASAPEAERPAPSYGILRQGTTASAPVRWGGPCAAPAGGSVLVNWGAGPVTVPVRGLTSGACIGSSATPPRVGAFAGLS